MMKLNDFISKLELALKEPSRYEKGGWGKWNGTTWGWDCVCLIKGILWGWKNDKTKPRGGGATYASNGVPDIGTEAIYNACLKKSSNFTNLQVGELVHMSGHVGIYVGNGNIIESTTGWGTKKTIKSQIDSKGNRTYNGKGGSKPWTGHGFLPYVDYNETPAPTPTPEPEEIYPFNGTVKKGSSLYNDKGIKYTSSAAADRPVEVLDELNGRYKVNGKNFNPNVVYVDKTNVVKDTPTPTPTTSWTTGKYKLLYSKCIRKTPKLGNNILTVGRCDKVTQTKLTSTKSSANAMFKVGTEITISAIIKDGTRIWGQYGNCYVVLCNVDGTPQAVKVG